MDLELGSSISWGYRMSVREAVGHTRVFLLNQLGVRWSLWQEIKRRSVVSVHRKSLLKTICRFGETATCKVP